MELAPFRGTDQPKTQLPEEALRLPHGAGAPPIGGT